VHPPALEQEFQEPCRPAAGVGHRPAGRRGAAAGVRGLEHVRAVHRPPLEQGRGAPALADRKDLCVDDGPPDGDRQDHLDRCAAARDRQDHLDRCAAARDRPGPVSALVLSTPLGVGGTLLFAVGATTVRPRRHEDLRARAAA
jgi:hypothetical protein